MKSHEPFIEPESTYYVYSPSLLGRSMFFIRLHAVIFSMHQAIICTALLFDSFLLIYVKKGSMYVQTKRRKL